MAEFRLIIRARQYVSGPLFDQRGPAAISDWADELEEEAAEWALNHIKGTFHTHFQNPTGYYESNVRVRNAAGGAEVWDGGLSGPVYGPWLEGVGSRNQTTRFKGYRAFRKAAQALEARIESIGDQLFRERFRRRLE